MHGIYWHALAYVHRSASASIGSTTRCDIERQRAYIDVARHVDAFGPVSGWGADDVETLGNVIGIQ